MKLCPLLAVLASLGLPCLLATAAEKPGPFATSISSTTIRGYIYSGSRWRQHVCRPAVPVRMLRIVEVSTNGVPREIGTSVRCRHGVVFVPNSVNNGGLPTPNRSSAFALSMQRRATPGRPGPPPLPPLPPRPERRDRTNIVVFPPRPPRGVTNRPPIVVLPPLVITNVPPVIVIPRPTNSVTLPPVIVGPPVNGSTGVEASRLGSDSSRRTRLLPSP